MYGWKFFGFYKALIKRIGWFDERFLGGYYEDYDTILRLDEANVSCYESWETPCLNLLSSWLIHRMPRDHWTKKWRHTPEGFVRLENEETYNYFLGNHPDIVFTDRTHSNVGPRHTGLVLKVKK